MNEFIITETLDNDVAKRRKKYLLLMFLRILLVPGLLFLPIIIELKVVLVLIAAISQFVAVLSANIPDNKIEDNNIIINK
jgi:hypothetical protein